VFETRIAPVGLACFCALAAVAAWPADATPPAPSGTIAAADDSSQAISDFQRAVTEDGFPAGLRTYARVVEFRLYAADQAPMAVADAIAYLTAHRLHGAWHEEIRGRSDEYHLAYAVGEFGDTGKEDRCTYVEIWQYDPKVANWGLRFLLISPLGPSKTKA
jgi:hypothetical protein